jgi:N-acyl-D-amino-acid deacylase
MKADLIIFNPEKVRETASYPDPLRLADGFDVVVMNGEVVREQGRLSALMHSVVLRP